MSTEVSAETPEAYTKNTNKEDITLEYVDNFRRQFVQLYPSRAKLLLAPRNECGVEKLICTFIRPTKLPYKELYDMQGCAKFVSDHLLYEPLQVPSEVPIEVKSPTAVLKLQKGNCYEYSTLLVSLLNGVGYDAYCVSGYAEISTTQNDLSKSSLPSEQPSLGTENDNETIASTYDQLLSKRPYLQSQFLQKQEEKRRVAEEIKAPKSTEIGSECASENSKQLVYRTHCWVLVLPPKRDVDIPVFIEPTTGTIFPLDVSPFFKIEAVWNDTNYWVNMQETVQSNLSQLAYDLLDVKKWEPIFMDAGNSKDEASDSLVLKCPASWVLRLDISKEAYNTRFPNGQKSTWYCMCLVEQFALYHRSDGMVSKSTFYKDSDHTQVERIVELFANRKDFLEQRKMFPEESRFCEYFGKGKASGLQRYTFIPGHKQEFSFWPGNRIDGLVKREEVFREKIAETYSERDDCMVYRSATFSEDFQSADAVKLFDGETSRPIKKLTQKFARCSELPADSDVQKIVFLLQQKKIQVTYHRAHGRVTASSRTYTKDGKAKGFQVDPFAHKPNPRELFEDFQKFSSMERDCIQKLRDMERETSEVIRTREREESNIGLIVSVYDMKPNKSTKEQVEHQIETEWTSRERDRSDILAPFMHLLNDKVMTKELALQVKESALKTLKERLIQKANLIQNRIDKEAQSLARHTNHQRGKESPAPNAVIQENNDEHERFKNETMFKIHILEQRLARHEKLAIEKFQESDAKLTNDPRLAPFFK